jgi:hypothetical protein
MPILIPVVLGVVRVATMIAARKAAQNQVKKVVAAQAAKSVAKQVAAKKSAAVATKAAVNKTASGFTAKNVLKKGAFLAVGGIPKSKAGKLIYGTAAAALLLRGDTRATQTDKGGSNNGSSVTKAKPKGKSVTKSKTTVEQDTTPSPIPEADPNDYSWNLPPHTWSLPKLPTDVNNPGGAYQNFGKPQVSSDTYRRGRLWWRQSADVAIQTGSTEKDNQNRKVESVASGDHERRFGFQFMWNPDAIQTQVAVQMDAVPNVNDMFLSLVAAFPATQSIAFNIRLDRTNDFACAQARFERPGLSTPKPDTTSRPDAVYDSALFARQQLRQETVRDFGQYYLLAGAFQQSSTQLEEKLMDLFTRGTLADIEFLYKTINGDGAGSMKWTNRRGIQTADIGYLMPTLLNIDIGPLSYQGYVNSLSVTHTSFTPDMVPIRSDLSISLQVLATSGLALASSIGN